MVNLALHEAQLFRLLSGLFGGERVVPHMRVISVCGGALPAAAADPAGEHLEWARNNRCLFTIVDADDNPCLVVEFFSGFEEFIEPTEAEHQRFLKPILEAQGIRYVTISPAEFSEILDPQSSLDLVAFLRDKVDPAAASNEEYNA
ncbi:MAG: hypothetical protein RL417_1259 [Pseudomonadota bacterium]|jgi:hypothetical protein